MTDRRFCGRTYETPVFEVTEESIRGQTAQEIRVRVDGEVAGGRESIDHVPGDAHTARP